MSRKKDEDILDVFAVHALTGLLFKNKLKCQDDCDELVKEAYTIALTMLLKRNEIHLDLNREQDVSEGGAE